MPAWLRVWHELPFTRNLIERRDRWACSPSILLYPFAAFFPFSSFLSFCHRLFLLPAVSCFYTASCKACTAWCLRLCRARLERFNDETSGVHVQRKRVTERFLRHDSPADDIEQRNRLVVIVFRSKTKLQRLRKVLTRCYILLQHLQNFLKTRVTVLLRRLVRSIEFQSERNNFDQTFKIANWELLDDSDFSKSNFRRMSSYFMLERIFYNWFPITV